MSMIDPATEHQAVNRLFELSRNGELDNLEFTQLDALIYERLQQTYRVSANDMQCERVLAVE